MLCCVYINMYKLEHLLYSIAIQKNGNSIHVKVIESHFDT